MDILVHIALVAELWDLGKEKLLGIGISEQEVRNHSKK